MVVGSALEGSPRYSRGSPAVGAIGAVEGGEVDLLDGVSDEPREVIVGQPVAQAGRQHQLLLAVGLDEVLRCSRSARGWRGVVMTPKTVAEIERLRRGGGGAQVAEHEHEVAA